MGQPARQLEQCFIGVCAQPELTGTEAFMDRYEVKWMRPPPFWKALI